MYCDGCGTQLPDDAAFCLNCGKDVRDLFAEELITSHESESEIETKAIEAADPSFKGEEQTEDLEDLYEIQNYTEQYKYTQTPIASHETELFTQLDMPTNEDLYEIQNYTKQFAETKLDMPTLGELVLSENEELVRQYHCSSVKEPKCEGYLSVTNKRMLFQAEGAGFLFGKPGRISKEISLDKITGLDCYYGINVSLKQLIAGIILTVLGIFSVVKVHGFYSDSTLFYILFCVGIILMLTCHRRSFKMSVYASECSPSPIVLGEGAKSLHGNGVLYSVVSAPTEDTNRMMNELGALVKDIQTMGDLAISKWKS